MRRRRLTARRLLLRAALSTALTFAVLQWLRPWAEAERRRQEEIRAQLRSELGREPTEDEVIGRRMGRD